MAGMSLAFALLVACSGEDGSASVDPNGDNPFIITTDTIVDRNGDTIIRQDTARKHIDTIMHITEKGETTFVAETLYVGLDTTLHWVGNSALVITEIMTVNLDWTDEDGDDGAWIEIYNAGSENANLKGYSLVENADKSRKWVFGNEVIKAKSFRIVFCDKKNHAVAAGAKDTTLKRKDGEEYYAHYRTHTNWKLNNKGGTVYLIDPYYAIRDSVDYPELKSGISWGIMDGGVWKFFDKPTPEERNTESKAYDDLVNPKSQAPVVSLVVVSVLLIPAVLMLAYLILYSTKKKGSTVRSVVGLPVLLSAAMATGAFVALYVLAGLLVAVVVADVIIIVKNPQAIKDIKNFKQLFKKDAKNDPVATETAPVAPTQPVEATEPAAEETQEEVKAELVAKKPAPVERKPAEIMARPHVRLRRKKETTD